MPTISSRLAENLFSLPIVIAPRVEQLLGVTRLTAQTAIDALIERRELAEVTGRERNRIYEASRIFDAVYGTVEVPEAAGAARLDLRLQ